MSSNKFSIPQDKAYQVFKGSAEVWLLFGIKTLLHLDLNSERFSSKIKTWEFFDIWGGSFFSVFSQLLHFPKGGGEFFHIFPKFWFSQVQGGAGAHNLGWFPKFSRIWVLTACFSKNKGDGGKIRDSSVQQQFHFKHKPAVLHIYFVIWFVFSNKQKNNLLWAH